MHCSRFIPRLPNSLSAVSSTKAIRSDLSGQRLARRLLLPLRPRVGADDTAASRIGSIQGHEHGQPSKMLHPGCELGKSPISIQPSRRWSSILRCGTYLTIGQVMPRAIAWGVTIILFRPAILVETVAKASGLAISAVNVARLPELLGKRDGDG
jgi:hypothetical protein